MVVGCSLTSLDGLSGPGAADAGASRDGDAPTTCTCPAGTTLTNGVCVIAAPSAGYACAVPIVAPACALTYEAELCSTHASLAYATACGTAPRPSVFFTLGNLSGASSEGGARKWLVTSQNAEVLGRTNAACTQGIEPCVVGTSPKGELTPGGATVVLGKTVASGCQTIRIDIAAN